MTGNFKRHNQFCFWAPKLLASLTLTTKSRSVTIIIKESSVYFCGQDWGTQPTDKLSIMAKWGFTPSALVLIITMFIYWFTAWKLHYSNSHSNSCSWSIFLTSYLQAYLFPIIHCAVIHCNSTQFTPTEPNTDSMLRLMHPNYQKQRFLTMRDTLAKK